MGQRSDAWYDGDVGLQLLIVLGVAFVEPELHKRPEARVRRYLFAYENGYGFFTAIVYPGTGEEIDVSPRFCRPGPLLSRSSRSTQ